MSKLYVTEYIAAALPYPYGGSTSNPYQNFPLDAAQEPEIITQVLDFTSGMATSVAFNARTRFVRLNCDAVCSVAFGPNPTATTDSQRMSSNQTEYKGVNPGDKVAVIANT